jgi:hypothetical protein
VVVAFYRIYPVERHIHWLPGAVGTLPGPKGVFSYLVPANSLGVVRVAR